MGTDALRLDDVTKTFRRAGGGNRPAVDSLSMTVPNGSVFGLLGPNGSGKTTTMRMIMNILMPDSGTVEVLGRHPSEVVREQVGYLPEERGLYTKMPVLEQLVFLAKLHGLRSGNARNAALDALAEYGNVSWADRKLEELSKGQQQTIQLAAALLHKPALVILDEPFTGLDPVNADKMRETIRSLRRDGRTVILSTHRMEQVEMLCDEICLISEGHPLVAGKLPDVRASCRKNAVHIVPIDETVTFEPDDVITRAEKRNDGWHLVLHPEADPQTVLTRVMNSGGIERFQLEEPTLDEIFVEAVTR